MTKRCVMCQDKFITLSSRRYCVRCLNVNRRRTRDKYLQLLLQHFRELGIKAWPAQDKLMGYVEVNGEVFKFAMGARRRGAQLRCLKGKVRSAGRVEFVWRANCQRVYTEARSKHMRWGRRKLYAWMLPGPGEVCECGTCEAVKVLGELPPKVAKVT